MKHFINGPDAALLGDEVIFNYIEAYGPDYLGMHVAKAIIPPIAAPGDKENPNEVLIGYYFEPNSTQVTLGELPGLVICVGDKQESWIVSEPKDVSLERAEEIFDAFSKATNEDEFYSLAKDFGGMIFYNT